MALALIKVAAERLGDTDEVPTLDGLTAVYSSRVRTLGDAVYDWSRFNSLPRVFGWIRAELAMEVEQGLLALREERGVSRTPLAKMIGVSQPAIAKLESGRTRNVDLKTLVRYAAALGGRLKVDVVREPRGRGGRPPHRG